MKRHRSGGERQDTASERSSGTCNMTRNRAPQVGAPSSEQEELLTPSEVAAMFRVNPKTVTRWARSGKISAIRTLGGHRRFRKSEITRILAEGGQNHGDAARPPHAVVAERGAAGGRGRRRSGDLALFRRVLCQLSYPAASEPAHVAGSPAVLTGFEPAASALTGRRALQTAPQDLVRRRSVACAPRGIRIPVTALKGQRPGPLDDGGSDPLKSTALYQRAPPRPHGHPHGASHGGGGLPSSAWP